MIVAVKERVGDVTIRWQEEVGDMKLKCNLCLEEKGVAVKTDELVMVTRNGADLLVCNSHKERMDGDRHHETKAYSHD